MAPMPQLRVRGTTFVLTGRMWKDRGDIHTDIVRMGGRASKVMRKGYVLVMASSQLERQPNNKWTVVGKATRKADVAMGMGAMVYHEKMLQDALANGGTSMATRVSKVQDPTRTPKQQAKQAREHAPEWDDEMQARLDANMRETSELLSTFG